MADEKKIQDNDNEDNHPATSSTSDDKVKDSGQSENETKVEGRGKGKNKRLDESINMDMNKKQKLEDGYYPSSSSDSEMDSSSFRTLSTKAKKRVYSKKNKEESDDENSSDRPVVETHDSEDRTRPLIDDSAIAVDDDKEDSSDSFETSSISIRTEDVDHESDCDHSISSVSSYHSQIVLLDVPKPRWHAVHALTNRQIGIDNTIFERKFYGSLNAIQRLQSMAKLEGHIGCVNALDFNKSGDLLASSSDDLKLIIWDWSRRKIKRSLQTGHRSNVFQVKWMHLEPEHLLMTAGRDGDVRLINLHSDTQHKVARHGSPSTFDLHPEIPHVALSVGEDAKIMLIDIRESKAQTLTTVKDRRNVALNSISINPCNKNEFCVAGHCSRVLIYDKRKPSNAVKKLYPEHLKSGFWYPHITDACYNFNGTEILASYVNENIYLFDNENNSHTTRNLYAHRYWGHRNYATKKGVSFCGPESEFIMSGSDCGNIFIWDKKSEAIVQWMHGDDQGVVNRLEMHPSLPILATSGLDHDIKIWVPTCEDHERNDQTLKVCMQNNFRSQAELDQFPDIHSEVLWMVLQRPISLMVSNVERPSLSTSNEENDSSNDNGSSNAEFSSDESSNGDLSYMPSDCRPS